MLINSAFFQLLLKDFPADIGCIVNLFFSFFLLNISYLSRPRQTLWENDSCHVTNCSASSLQNGVKQAVALSTSQQTLFVPGDRRFLLFVSNPGCNVSGTKVVPFILFLFSMIKWKQQYPLWVVYSASVSFCDSSTFLSDDVEQV